MNNSLKYRLSVFQRIFFILFIAVCGSVALSPTLSATPPAGSNGGNVGNIFKNTTSGTTSADEARADQWMSDMLWWVRRISGFICVILFIISVVLYVTGKAPLNVVIPALVGIALIGGGVEIGSRLFFDVGSSAAGR